MSDRIIQAGTILTIDEKFMDNVRVIHDWGLIEDRDYDIFRYGLDKEWLPAQIQFSEYRTDRKRVFLSWKFLGGHLASFENINGAYWRVFRAMGFSVIEPESKEIPLLVAADDILSPREIVLKYFILENGKSHKDQAWAEGVFAAIEDIMDQHEIVFYKP